ncbi:MAG: hypothetical protein JST54_34750 [Deltaproteobacteria bacterium]|nr:hypothetical protein [Deltaproteobacteria bacterium]
MRAFVFTLVAALALTACSGSSTTDGGSGDAGNDAGAVDAGCVYTPTHVDAGYDDTCTNPCSLGNALGVGKFCTPHGGECDTNPTAGAIICDAAFQATNEWFCTMTCQCDSDCGEGAICTGDGSGGGPMGCVPLTCSGGQAGNPICPYPDGGYPDAGPGDGG